ncbi:MAG TPA: F0F1 ATP synthase subunit delta [Candidatus Dormibacteraeota bacterium]|nr:F0F1 ATP synthase subunit delta [Candidatus Dormibacteraeota bacterium]
MATAAARRYARAVFELAQQDGQVAEWGRRVAHVRDLLSNEDVAAVVTNPTIAVADRMALISATPHELDPEATNLAKLLIESNRVADVDAVAKEYERLADESAGRVRATITTAVELKPADRDRMSAELSKRLGQEVRMDVVVDPRILGGMKLQYGDRLVDASVLTKLQQLRRRLAAT